MSSELSAAVQRVINQILDPATKQAVQKLVEWIIAELDGKANK
jgi:hypothetical protein